MAERCAQCGKKIASRTRGDVTQWELRQELCSCRSRLLPEHRRVARPTTDQAEIEIKLDNELFPRDRYKPLAELGQGSAGNVYLCRDRVLGKKVAVKTLRRSTPDQLIAFHQEARATSALNHPNIVTILDFGTTGEGAPYMVLDYVAGESLEHYIQQGQLPIQTALSIVSELAQALGYAHSIGVFHRDLKPSNVLVIENQDETLSVRLIDFGVAKLSLAQEPTIVQGITVVGTPAYMSPDQVNGHQYDARSEIYSLGCILFECITGRPPFQGETAMEMISKHSKSKPPRMADLTSEEIPKEVQVLVDRCLMKDPEARYGSMTELKEGLDLLQPAVREIQPSRTVPTEPPPKRNRQIVRGAVAGLTVIATFLGLIIFTLSRDTETVDDHVKQAPFSPKSSRFIFRGNLVEPATSVKDDDLKELANKTFSRLNLYDTPVTGAGLKYLRESRVKYINLDRSALQDRYFKYINELPELRAISMAETGIGLNGLEQLTKTNLKGLHVSGCPNFDDSCLDFVVNRWPGITALSVGLTGITDDAFVRIAGLRNLTYLGMTGGKAAPEQFGTLANSNIEELFCAESTIDEAGLAAIARMKHLKILSIRDCHSLPDRAIENFKSSRRDVDIRVIGGQLRAKRVEDLNSLLNDSEENLEDRNGDVEVVESH